MFFNFLGFSLMLVGPTDRTNFLKLLRLPGKGNKVFQNDILFAQIFISIVKAFPPAKIDGDGNF